MILYCHSLACKLPCQVTTLGNEGENLRCTLFCTNDIQKCYLQENTVPYELSKLYSR